MYQIYWQVWWKKQNVTIIGGNLPVGTSNLRRFTHQMLLIFWSEPKWLHKQNLLGFFFCSCSKKPKQNSYKAVNMANKNYYPTKSPWTWKPTQPPSVISPITIVKRFAMWYSCISPPSQKKLFSWKSLLVLRSSCVYPSNQNCGFFPFVHATPTKAYSKACC